jgi:multidrug efflux pump subunit AcrA (membrane-fusion protein)
MSDSKELELATALAETQQRRTVAEAEMLKWQAQMLHCDGEIRSLQAQVTALRLPDEIRRLVASIGGPFEVAPPSDG